MNELPYIETAEIFRQQLKGLHAARKSGKTKNKRIYRLTKEQRQIIYSKTGGKCHVCGQVS
jgi:hypothetical protein